MTSVSFYDFLPKEPKMKLFDRKILDGATIRYPDPGDRDRLEVTLADGRVLTYRRRLLDWRPSVLVRGTLPDGTSATLCSASFGSTRWDLNEKQITEWWAAAVGTMYDAEHSVAEAASEKFRDLY